MINEQLFSAWYANAECLPDISARMECHVWNSYPGGCDNLDRVLVIAQSAGVPGYDWDSLEAQAQYLRDNWERFALPAG
jgi:hypothetical protein